MRWIALVVGLMGCGGLQAEHGSELVAVVFESDFLDVYGPIEIEFGESRISLKRNGQFSCDRPAFMVDAKSFQLRALSQNMYAWKRNVELDSALSCHVIGLNAASMWSGMHVMSFGGEWSERCFPYRLNLVDGSSDHEWVVGEIHRVWDDRQPEFSGEEDEEEFWGTLRSHYLQAAREGYVAVLAGGLEEGVRLHFRLESEDEACGGVEENSFEISPEVVSGAHWSVRY